MYIWLKNGKKISLVWYAKDGKRWIAMDAERQCFAKDEKPNNIWHCEFHDAEYIRNRADKAMKKGKRDLPNYRGSNSTHGLGCRP